MYNEEIIFLLFIYNLLFVTGSFKILYLNLHSFFFNNFSTIFNLFVSRICFNIYIFVCAFLKCNI